MLKNPYVKNIFSVLAVAFFGFILLNLTFMFYAASTNLVSLFFPADFARTSHWFMPFMMTVNSLIIFVISWLVFKSKLGDIFKATYSVVPLAVLFLAIGILLYRWLAISLSINALVFVAILAYLYTTKKSWLYYYALILISLALLIIALLGIDI